MRKFSWIIAVLKCRAEDAPSFLVDFYDFVEDLEEVKDLHFLIRDRVDDDAIFSFRFLTEKKNYRIAHSKISFKLKSHFPNERFILNPEATHPLFKFAAFPWRQAVKDRGAERYRHSISGGCHIFENLPRCKSNDPHKDEKGDIPLGFKQ